MKMTLRSRMAVLLAAWTLVCASGCVIPPQSATIAPGHRAQARSGHEAVIERVIVADGRVMNAEDIEESLTTNVAQLVSEAGYFKQVKVTPEQTTDGYHVRLSFERYAVARFQHPAFVPATFVTLTFYIWFGGPIYKDQVDLKANLRIQAADGQTLVTVTDGVTYSENAGLYSPNFGSSDGSTQRTKFIQSLLDRAVAQLETTGARP